MDAIAYFPMHLDFNIKGLRDFKCCNFQLVLPLHIATTEELHGVKYL
jgi:hypothetical protein